MTVICIHKADLNLVYLESSLGKVLYMYTGFSSNKGNQRNIFLVLLLITVKLKRMNLNM